MHNKVSTLILMMIFACQIAYADNHNLSVLFKQGEYEECIKIASSPGPDNLSIYSDEELDFVKIYCEAEIINANKRLDTTLLRLRNYELKYPESKFFSIVKYEYGKLLLSYALQNDREQIEFIHKKSGKQVGNEKERLEIELAARHNQIIGVRYMAAKDQSSLCLREFLEQWNMDYLSGAIDNYFSIEQLKIMEIEALHLVGDQNKSISYADALMTNVNIGSEIKSEAYFFRGLAELGLTPSNIDGAKDSFLKSLEYSNDDMRIMMDEIYLWFQAIDKVETSGDRNRSVFTYIMDMKAEAEDMNAWYASTSHVGIHLDCKCY